MNAYRNEVSTRRPLFAVAAITLSFATFALAVALPARQVPMQVEPATLAARAPSASPVEVMIHPARIDVVGERRHDTAQDEARDLRPQRRG